MLGLGVNKLWTQSGQQDEYAVLSRKAPLVAAFEDEYYRTNGAQTTFSNLITHARAGNATMTDSDGLIKWAPHNLLSYSEDFTKWNLLGFIVSSVNSAIAPDGSQTADKIQTTATAGSIQYTTSLSASVSHTLVFYAKYIDNPWIRIARESSAVNCAWFNIQTGETGTVTDPADSSSITAVGNGWYRLELVMAAPSSASQINFVSLSDTDNTTTMTGGKSAYVWGAHLYRSDLGGMVDNPDRGDSYVPTTSSAVYLPRRGHHVYNGYEWVNEGVLAESEARTNLVTYSDFSSGWTNSAASMSTNSITGPDGQLSAAVHTPSATTGDHYVAYNQSVTSGSAYTISVIAKANGFDTLRISNSSAYFAGSGTAYFDLQNGTVGTTSANDTATIEDYGNGWYRCSMTDTATTSGTSGFAIRAGSGDNFDFLNVVGDGVKGVYLYNAQIEVGSTPSSLIPTSGSSVTRAAETFTIPSAKLPWPTPVYIGDELVTNGTFDTDTSGWSVSNVTTEITDGEVKLTSTVAFGGIFQSFSTEVGKVYKVEITSRKNTAFQARARVYNSNNTVIHATLDNTTTSNITQSAIFVATTSTSNIKLEVGDSNTGRIVYFDNISVREVNPLSVSIQMDGRLSFADTDDPNEGLFYRWYIDDDNRIQTFLSTSGANTGQMIFYQEEGNVSDFVSTATDYYDTGILTPFNIASRHGSTFINGATEGVALTANTTPTKLVDLSSTDMRIAYAYMGTIKTFRIWDKDLGDTGIVAATAPSLEPSLSLSFDSTESSFIDLGWD